MTASGSNPCPHVRVVERNGSGTDLTPSLGSPNVAFASAPAREAQNETDPIHVWGVWDPTRYLCGLPRPNTMDPGRSYDRSEECVVCADLASSFIDGGWRP